MGKYTAHGKEVDGVIENKLKMITEQIKKNLPEVKSILLVGGYGKGEGSAKISEDGRITLLKDFDFLLLFENRIPYSRVMNVEKKLRVLFSEGKHSNPYKYSKFSVDLNPTTINRINCNPDVTTYDAKEASVLLFGADFRKEISVRSQEIPLRSGIRILFQKGISMIGQMSFNYLSEKIPEDSRDMFIYETVKVFVELGTALCVLARKYHPLYKERSEFLVENYATLFPELYEKLPDLAAEIKIYTNFKLNPEYNIIKDPVELWFSARECHKIVIEYYLNKFLGIKTSQNWLDFCTRLKNQLNNVYYNSLIARLLYSKIGHEPKPLILLLNKLFQIYEFHNYIRNVKKNPRFNIFKTYNFFSPTINFFIATLLILHSIQKDGNYNEEYLIKARKLLGITPKSISNSLENSWEKTRLIYLDVLNMLPFVI